MVLVAISGGSGSGLAGCGMSGSGMSGSGMSGLKAVTGSADKCNMRATVSRAVGVLMMLVQIYEVRTALEAAALTQIGVDHIGVLVGDGAFPREIPPVRARG